jgi:hypothetical protein
MVVVVTSFAAATAFASATAFAFVTVSGRPGMS